MKTFPEVNVDTVNGSVSTLTDGQMMIEMTVVRHGLKSETTLIDLEQHYIGFCENKSDVLIVFHVFISLALSLLTLSHSCSFSLSIYMDRS